MQAGILTAGTQRVVTAAPEAANGAAYNFTAAAPARGVVAPVAAAPRRASLRLTLPALVRPIEPPPPGTGLATASPALGLGAPLVLPPLNRDSARPREPPPPARMAINSPEPAAAAGPNAGPRRASLPLFRAVTDGPRAPDAPGGAAPSADSGGLLPPPLQLHGGTVVPPLSRPLVVNVELRRRRSGG